MIHPIQDKKTVVVVGDGWAALGAVGFLVTEKVETQVIWVAGTGARLVPPLPTLPPGRGAIAWYQLASRLGLELEEPEPGSYLRQFRNKAFREALWTKAPTPEARLEVMKEELWAPETRFLEGFEVRFRMSLGDLEEEIRKRLSEMPQIKKIEEVPILEVKLVQKGDTSGVHLTLGNGTDLLCDQVIYADSWTALLAVQGIPKPLAFLRNRHPMGAIQALFTHDFPESSAHNLGELKHGFFNTLHKESGEEFQRNLWGYFMEDNRRSVWTVYLSPEEVEDNHEITKKLRRMKQALDKMFAGSSWLPEGKPDFMSTVQTEQVRLQESQVFSTGTIPEKAIRLPHHPEFHVLTDGYGPAAALEQVVELLHVSVASQGLTSNQDESGLKTEPNAQTNLDSNSESNSEDSGSLNQA